MRRSKFLIASIIVAAFICAVISITSVAAISVDNGTVIGLDPNVVYSYAKVTLSNHKSPSYTDLDKGTTKIEGLSAGLWYVYNTSTATKTAVWIEGDSDDRINIGDVYYNATYGKDVVRAQNTTDFVDGVWTGKGSFNHSSFATYYLSDLGGNHITINDAKSFLAGTVSKSTIASKIEQIYYRYSYTSEEIIPVKDLYTIGFNIGVRQGSIYLDYLDTAEDKDLKTKYVLYTIEENGNMVTHTAYIPTIYGSSSQGVFINESFPDAKGWVVGIEIFPFGDVPTHGLQFNVIPGSSGDYLNTIYFIEYVPNGYTTKDKAGVINIPFQYNGANSAYIEGYGDGTFQPDGDITKAEAITLLARLLNKGADIPSVTACPFVDCSVGDWYYKAVSYVAYANGFAYTNSARLKPNEAITRGELAELLYSTAKPEAKDTCVFSDVSEEDKCYTAVCTLASAGIIEGYEDGTFRPYSTVTRAETVTMLNRLINLVVNERTVVKDTLKNSFSDIEGHWAEYQILMAANDNVKTVNHLNASASGLVDNGTEIVIETDLVKIAVNKSNGKVNSILNKYDSTDIKGTSATPWFTYISAEGGITYAPMELDIVDNRLRVRYRNGNEAYFIVSIKDDFYTIELDSELPLGISSLVFTNLNVKTDFSDEDEDSYRICGVTMTANTNTSNFPGGAAKKVDARVMRKFGGFGAKMGVVFSKFGGKVEGEHRAILKKIVNEIDPRYGTYSNHGGAFTADHTDVYGDYVILSSGFTPSTAVETAQVMKKYSIDQLDMHQGSTFIQGEFNFVCADTENKEAFTTAKQFDERVGSLARAEGIQIGLHTYSSLVPSNATTILTDPKWQKQICYDEDNVLTLASDITSNSTVFLTNEDASGLTMASSDVPWSGPATRYYLIDEEIVLVTAFDSTGLTKVTRGRCGTTATTHLAGAEIRQFQCWYGMFQPIPGSELFYHIADNTAKAFNEGNFDMIYLDGLESFTSFVHKNDTWYYYATFIQRVVSGCNKSPIIEGSAFPIGFWTSRARGGAWDHSHRDYKHFNTNHLNSNKTLLNYYCTATLGWFHYSPDMGDKFKNTAVKSVFRDDLDSMGSMGIAFDMTTVCQPFSVSNFKNYKSLADNTMYYSLYSRIRKGGYFSPAVKKTLRLGINEGKEYRLEEQSDGSWAFREMTYFKNKVFDTVDSLYVTGNATNTYSAQTPYVRIEQRYSTLGADEQVLYAFDETAQVVAGSFDTTATGGSTRQTYKIKVYGNNSTTDALMLSLNNNYNFFIPLNYSGWREFILMDSDNSDHPGYKFSGENEYFRGTTSSTVSSVKVMLCGKCTGVMLDDLRACTTINAPATNPSVTVGSNKITFNTTVRSGEYIEYFPELNKAYHHYYGNNGEGNNNTKAVKEITFSGSITVPAGDFTYTYGGTGTTAAPLRAQVVIGVKGDEIIANESTWEAPTIELEEDLQYITLK